MKHFLVLALIPIVTSFVLPHVGRQYRIKNDNKVGNLCLSMKHESTSGSETSSKPWWEEMILAILEALPLAMRTPSTEMDPSKVVHNPPAFYKPGTASSFRKAHHTESAWKTQDIIDDFNAKYGVGVPVEAITGHATTTQHQPVKQSKAALVELLVC